MDAAGDPRLSARAVADCFLPNGADDSGAGAVFRSDGEATGDMLVKVDRMSMANSLEVRCPLLDHELAELAATIPHEWKIRNGRGKHILIDALGDRLPAELLNRPKMGFGVPLADWFRGTAAADASRPSGEPAFLRRGIVSPAFVRTMIAEHESRRRNNTTWLWSLLMLEMWFRRQEASRDAGAAEPVVPLRAQIPRYVRRHAPVGYFHAGRYY